MTSVPFFVVAIGALLAYLWVKRSREDEALPEYSTALIQLSHARAGAGEPDHVSERYRSLGWAVAKATMPKLKSLPEDQKQYLRERLLEASSPYLIEEAGLVPGSPRFVHTYNAVFRKLRELG